MSVRKLIREILMSDQGNSRSLENQKVWLTMAIGCSVIPCTVNATRQSCCTHIGLQFVSFATFEFTRRTDCDVFEFL